MQRKCWVTYDNAVDISLSDSVATIISITSSQWSYPPKLGPLHWIVQRISLATQPTPPELGPALEQRGVLGVLDVDSVRRPEALQGCDAPECQGRSQASTRTHMKQSQREWWFTIVIYNKKEKVQPFRRSWSCNWSPDLHTQTLLWYWRLLPPVPLPKPTLHSCRSSIPLFLELFPQLCYPQEASEYNKVKTELRISEMELQCTFCLETEMWYLESWGLLWICEHMHMHIPDCLLSLSCMSMTIQCCPLSHPAGFRWSVSLMALTSSVTLTKPLCDSGKSSPKSLWRKKKTSQETFTVDSLQSFNASSKNCSLSYTKRLMLV